MARTRVGSTLASALTLDGKGAWHRAFHVRTETPIDASRVRSVRIELHLRVSPAPIPPARLITTARLEAALREALRDEYRERLRPLCEGIRRERGVQAAVSVIEGHLGLPF